MTEELPQQPDLRRTVLVVDDVNDNLILISLSLQDMGYRVLTANDGEAGVAMAKLARPDLILMDIAMPQEDGLAATRRIREEIGLADTPIVALTAFDTDGFRQAAFDAGFNGYLTKPIDFDRLRKLLEMLLSGASGNFGGTTSQSGKNTTSLA
jgi:CheY-like chemotaxis protein